MIQRGIFFPYSFTSLLKTNLFLFFYHGPDNPDLLLLYAYYSKKSEFYAIKVVLYLLVYIFFTKPHTISDVGIGV